MLSAKLLLIATAGVSFLGYCIYFDRKRLADPDYRRKVHVRRQEEAKAKAQSVCGEERRQMGMGFLGGGGGGGGAGMVPLVARKTPVQLQFESEFRLGEYLLINGRVDDGLTHLSNAILLCSNPGSLLLSIQKSLPEQLIHPLLMRVAELQKQTSLESFSESDDDLVLGGAQAKDVPVNDDGPAIHHLPAPRLGV